MGITVFLSARTKPRGEPNRKKSDTSKSNFPRELPSSMVLLLDVRDAVSLRKMLECKLQGQHRVITGRRPKSKDRLDFCVPAANAPGEEGLVLLECVQFVGGGVAPFARQLLLGVIACSGTGDVDVTAAEMAAALQGRRGRPMAAVHSNSRRKEVLVLSGNKTFEKSCGKL